MPTESESSVQVTQATETLVQLSQSDVIGLIGAAATVVVAIVSWFISARHVRRTMERKELQYRMRVTPLVNKRLFKQADKLEIKFKDEIVDELVFLEVDVINSGNTPVDNPPIKIESRDSTYIIPAYLEDVPDGYDWHWEIEREDGETCLIKASHINPGQVIKARFLMDQMPPDSPMFSCAMSGLDVKQVSDIEVSPIATKLLEAMYPNLARTVKLLVG